MDSELLIKLVASKLRILAEAHAYLAPLGKLSASLGSVGCKALGDHCHGMASRNSLK